MVIEPSVFESLKFHCTLKKVSPGYGVIHVAILYPHGWGGGGGGGVGGGGEEDNFLYMA